MKQIILAFALLLAAAAPVAASPMLYFDVAPNAFGSPDYDPWWQAAKVDIAQNSYTNMRSGNFPGQNKFVADEVIATSFGDLGNRLHFIYWLPNTNVTEFEDNFQTRFAFDFGADYTIDETGYATLTPEAGWAAPGDTTWETFQGGIIGTFGFAYAAHDSAGAAALADSINDNQTYLRGAFRYDFSGNEDWTVQSEELQLATVPTPPILWLFLAALALTAACVLRRQTLNSCASSTTA